MNHAQLRAFHAVAQHGSFTRAALALRLTQPTLSGQVKDMQARYGVRLFERDGRGVRLTEAGRALHAVTQRLFALTAEAEQVLATAGSTEFGAFRLSADAPHHVVPVLAAFNRKHPKVRLSLAMGNTEQVLQQVLDRMSDVGVLADVRPDRRLATLPLRRDRLVLMVDRAHAWSRRRALDIGALSGSRLVLREPGSRTRAIFEAALERRGIIPGEVIEVSTREGVREAVAAGLGVGVVFASEFSADARLHAVSLRGAPLDSTEYLICLADRRKLPLVNVFFELARAPGLGFGAPSETSKPRLEKRAIS